MKNEEYYYYEKLYEEKAKESMRSCAFSLVGIILIVILSLLFAGCKSIQYIPVETVKIDTVYKNLVKYDSIYIKDSIYVAEKGDTVRIEHWHTKYKEKQIHDTLYISKKDSIQIPYPVERKLGKWEQIKMDMGGIAIGTCLAFVIFLIVYFIVRAHRKT